MSGLLPRLQILAAALLFSTGGAAIKSAAFTSWQVAGLRSLVAAVAIWIFLPQARRLGATAAARGRVLLVAIAYAATLVLFVLANKLTTSANTIFLQSTAPLYVLLLSPWLLGERARPRDLLFIGAVAAGMAVLLLGEQRSFATAPDPVRGNLLALASGLTYGCLILGLRWTGRGGGSAMPAVALGNLLAFLATLPDGAAHRAPPAEGLDHHHLPGGLPDRAWPTCCWLRPCPTSPRWRPRCCCSWRRRSIRSGPGWSMASPRGPRPCSGGLVILGATVGRTVLEGRTLRGNTRVETP
jgi:drug/metabolite transporter (DMT)-like permease